MGFDHLAPCYRTLELVLAGNVLQRCRKAFLADTKACRHALLLGEGPGRFLVELLRANPCARITCVERSAGMIAEAVRQVKRAGLNVARVRFEHCDALTWQPSRGEFDLVVTHFFLDCFCRDEVARLLAKIGAATTVDAQWVLTDFRMPPSGWQRWRARAVLTLMYAFFRAVTRLSASRLTTADEFLQAAGFRLAERRLANYGLVQADLWKRLEP